MTSTRFLSAILALSLVGCASGGANSLPASEGAMGQDPAAQAQGPAMAAGGAPAMDHSMHLPGLTATGGPGYTAADVHFMQMMIPHHQQALEMAAKAATHGAGPEVRALSLRIDISQRDEIAFMERWLRERSQPVPDEHAVHTMTMPGMLTPAEMARLDAARGGDFDRLFLNFMIEHHLGAIQMVDDLWAAPGAAQDSEIFRFASDVAADQLDEIGIMERILDRLSTTSPGSSPR